MHAQAVLPEAAAHSTGVARVKIYGERHTNTNYLARLISLNLRCSLVDGVVPTYVRTLERLFGGESWRDRYFERHYASTLGWKHSRPCTARMAEINAAEINDVAFVTLTKNPYAWLLSLYRRPYHQKINRQVSFEAFLDMPWRTVGRENLPAAMPDPVALWNLKSSSYLELPSLRTLNLTTESTFSDAESVLDRISRTFAIEPCRRGFVDFEVSTKKNREMAGNDYRDYYLNERWRKFLSASAIDKINTRLDPRLLERFDYAYL